MRKIALTPEEILSNTNPEIIDRAKSYKPVLFFQNKGTYTYHVPSADRNYRVIVKVTDPKTKDCKVTCECKYWKYYGCEYHANKHNFLYLYPTGRGTKPKIRDPKNQNWVCKHVASVLREMNTKQLSKMANKVASRYYRNSIIRSY